MSSYGIGQGLERGVGMATNALMQAMQMKQQRSLADIRTRLELEWQRGLAGLPPSSLDEEEDRQREPAYNPKLDTPSVPSVTYTEQPAQVGRFEVPGGSAIAPPTARPASTPPATRTPSPAELLILPSVAFRPAFRPRTRY